MAPWMKSAGAALAGVGAVAALGAAATRRMFTGRLPQTSGTLRMEGLHGQVTIDRDAWGIPHIAATTIEDLAFANGLVHAQDRLWQMEINRRVGTGTLAELFGDLALGADRFMRHLGLRRVAEEEVRLLDDETRLVLEAYSRGVNAYLAGPIGRSPLEFAIVRALPPAPLPRWRPAPWRPVDCLVFGKVMALGLCTNWTTELVRAAILERLGPERAAALEPLYAAEHPVVLPGAVVPRPLVHALIAAYAELAPFLEATGVGTGGFSNNWVLDGTRTASGKPLLANDPHLALQMPSIWYELELNGPGYDVTGASFPGTPGVVIGHNRRIAWGLTAALLDVQDLVIERINPANPRQYRYQDAWREGRLVREEIKVRGRREPVVDEVLITHHGPIISPAMPEERRALAMRWTALQPGNLARAVLSYNRAGNWQEFVGALRHWDAPAHNFVYADVDGNIGYYTPGVVPIRSKGSGALPVPGWTGEYEWTGTVPFAELPHAYNPPSGQIVTANNRLIGDDYPHNLGHEWMAGYRARRIADLLGERRGLTVEDCRRIQLDVYSLPGMGAAALLGELRGEDDLTRAALARAAAWDGHLTTESVGGAVCLVFQYHLLRAVFSPVLGDLTEAYLGTGSSPLAPRNGLFTRSIPFVYELARKRNDRWFARLGAEGTTWDGVLHAALRETIALLQTRLGPDIEQWRWGRLNRVRFGHVLGIRPPLDRLFNREPGGMGGDENTVAATALPLHSPHDRNGQGPSYRQIVDLGNLGNSLAMHTTGQSGHVASEHYDDMIPAWRAGRYHPMSLPIGDVRRELGGHLVLEPAPDQATPERR